MYVPPGVPREFTHRKVVWEWRTDRPTHTISTSHTSYHFPPVSTTACVTSYHRLNSTDDYAHLHHHHRPPTTTTTTTTTTFARYSPSAASTLSPPRIISCSTPTLSPIKPRLVTPLSGLGTYKSSELLLPVKEDRAVSVSSHARTKLLTEMTPCHDSAASLSPRRSNSSKPADPRVTAMHTSLSPRTHRVGVEDPEGVLQNQNHKVRLQSTMVTTKPTAEAYKRLSSRDYLASMTTRNRFPEDASSPSNTEHVSLSSNTEYKRAATTSVAATSTTLREQSEYSQPPPYRQTTLRHSVLSQSTTAPSILTQSTPSSMISANSQVSTNASGGSCISTSLPAVTPPTSQTSSPPASHHSSSSKSPNRRRRLMGLQNYGNTCYCNVILQGLLSCDDFCAYWLSKKSLRTNPASEFKTDLLKAWIEFLEDTHETISTTSSGKDHEHGPDKNASSKHKQLLELIRAHNPQFVPDTQADAHEFLQVLLKALSTETHKAAKPRPSTDPPKKKKSRSKSRYALSLTESGSLDVDDMDAEQASECSWRQQKSELNSEVENMWRSQFMSQLICRSCNKVRYRFEAEYDWDIEIPPGSAKPTLLELLESSVTKEDIVEIMCPRCKVITSSTLKRAPYKLPGNYFCLQIKRFGYNRSSGQTYRLNTPILLPPDDIIDFAKYSCGPPDKSSCFELMGLTMQEGSLENGHYTGLHKVSDSMTRNKGSINRSAAESSKWYLFSDEIVREVKNPRSIIDGGAIYLLWFRKCPPKLSLPLANRQDKGLCTSNTIPMSSPTDLSSVLHPPAFDSKTPSLSRRLAELNGK